MYNHILVAIDPYNPAQVDEAITAAKKLRSEQGTITLVTVLANIPPYAAEYVPVGQLELNRQAAEAKLKAFADGNGDLEILATSNASSAGAALVELSVENEADLIIIASHRPGLKDYFLGSTAERVVRHAPCAVHVLRELIDLQNNW